MILFDRSCDLSYRLDDGLRHDAVSLVVLILDLASAGCLVDTRLHRRADVISVHDDAAVLITGSSSDCLDERGLITEESLLVSIKYRYERDLRKVETFTQQVDAYQDIEFCHSQVSYDLQSLKIIYV